MWGGSDGDQRTRAGTRLGLFQAHRRQQDACRAALPWVACPPRAVFLFSPGASGRWGQPTACSTLHHFR